MRKLMMIAIAALALTSCQKDNDDIDVNDVTSTTKDGIFNKHWKWEDGDDGSSQLFANGDVKYTWLDDKCYYDVENLYKDYDVTVHEYSNKMISYSQTFHEDNDVYEDIVEIYVSGGRLVHEEIFLTNGKVTDREFTYLNEIKNAYCDGAIEYTYDDKGKSSQPRRVRLF